MTAHYLQRWLSNQAFYHLELLRFVKQPDAQGLQGNPDNPDQRIAADINGFISQSLSLAMGLLNSVVTLASFVGILWGLSGSFGFTLGGQEFSIPGFMVWVAVLYCLAGSVITHYVGRKQIALNFEQERREADFRHHMVRVRENSEAIALERGEHVVLQQTSHRFSGVLENFLALLRAQKQLNWFTSFFGQASVVFPFLIAAPRYFSNAIQLGELMQISSAFGQVQGALSWLVENYPSVASWRATTERLTAFEAAFQALALTESAQNASNSIANDNQVEAEGLRVSLPDGTPLLGPTVLHAVAGDRVLLQGPSGSGKSSLFRTLAGIWPFAQGQVRMPANTMFLPQRPYFPNGPLREALAYPLPPATYTDAQLQQALDDALLPQLKTELDRSDAWGQKLSGGEQQRLSIARVLLNKPKWVFADEATSALDEAAEGVIYQRLCDMVAEKGGGLVSIAHRPALARFHNRRWVLEPGADGGGQAALFTLAAKPA